MALSSPIIISPWLVMFCCSSILLWVFHLSIKWHSRRNQLWIFKFNVNSILIASILLFLKLSSPFWIRTTNQTTSWPALSLSGCHEYAATGPVTDDKRDERGVLKKWWLTVWGYSPSRQGHQGSSTWGSWLHCVHGQGAEKDGCYSVCFLTSIQSGILAYELVWPTFWMGL